MARFDEIRFSMSALDAWHRHGPPSGFGKFHTTDATWWDAGTVRPTTSRGLIYVMAWLEGFKSSSPNLGREYGSQLTQDASGRVLQAETLPFGEDG